MDEIKFGQAPANPGVEAGRKIKAPAGGQAREENGLEVFFRETGTIYTEITGKDGDLMPSLGEVSGCLVCDLD
jgi:hypothetical protein